MNQPILIVGGGIGGLTAALALQRHGRRVVIFEQAGEIGDVGAGISLGATASRGLYHLGLTDRLSAAADAPQASAALHYQTGEPLAGSFTDRDWKGADLADTHLIHRADLFEILKSAVLAHDPDALRLGRRFAGFQQDTGGVTLDFQDAPAVRGEALVGCDGIRSAVRDVMFGQESPLFTGRVVYRFLVPMQAARPFMSTGGSNSYVGPGRSLLRYAIRKGTLVNCVAFTRSDAWRGEGWSERASKPELMALFADWHPDVIGLASAAPAEATAKWALYDRDPLDIWVQGRAALLGDAAHPMLPFLGMGAAMAIEDAVVLGRAFGAHARAEDALRAYQRARSGRAGAILLASRRQGEVFGDGPDSRREPPMSFKERMNYDPATAPI